MQVRDVLMAKNRSAITVGPEATVSEAIARLVQYNIGSVPVIDEQGRLVGIFTERDVLRGVHNRGEGFGRLRISDVMTPRPVTCEINDDVYHAMARMNEYKIGQLPVLDDDDLVGVVSVGDVIKLMCERLETENRHLLDYLYGPG